MIFDFSFFVFNQIEPIVIDSETERERETSSIVIETKNTIEIVAGNI